MGDEYGRETRGHDKFTVKGGVAVSFPDGIELASTNDPAKSEWMLNGHLHVGMPVLHPDGRKEWYRSGELHRDNGPAIEYRDGSKEWWQNGTRHRDDEPAVTRPDGHEEWYVNGQRHRDGGPALKSLEVTAWFRQGELHREDGPAVERLDGRVEFWRGGKEVASFSRGQVEAAAAAGHDLHNMSVQEMLDTVARKTQPGVAVPALK